MLHAILLVDWRPPYAAGSSTASLLLTPSGGTALLARLHHGLAAAEAGQFCLVPNFAFSPEYVEAVRALVPEAEVLPPEGRARFFDAHEPSDLLLIVDSRYYPLPGGELERLLAPLPGDPLTKHLVRMRRSAGGVDERVVYDAQRRVRAIQRLYDGVTQLESVGVSCTLTTAVVARRAADTLPFTPATVRTRLAGANLPARDVLSSVATLDLLEPRHILAHNERLAETTLDEPLPAPYRLLAPGVWVTDGVEIAETARLFGPLILQSGVQVGSDALIAGPAVLGPRAKVAAGAVLVRCVVGSAAHVPAGATYTDALLSTSELGELQVFETRAPLVSLQADGRWDGSAPPALVPPRAQAFHAGVKRTLDFVLAAVGLIALSPLLLLVAALVKLTSPGPIFFGHHREGRGGRIFRCWKFRTMVERAHAQQRALYNTNTVDGPQFKMPNDPRITPLGRILRVTNIDELPQLFNVVRGEMSLIGPRPSPFRENQICVPWRAARLSVRPGITGLWQVCRRERATGDFHQWIYYDILYVRHQSLALDVRIFLATFLTAGGRWGIPVRWMIPPARPQRGARSQAQGSASGALTAPQPS